MFESVQMAADDTTKEVLIPLTSGAVFAINVTVMDEAGNRAAHEEIRYTDVADWQANFQTTPNAWAFDNDTGSPSEDDPGGRVGHRVLMSSVNEMLVIGGMANGINLVAEVHKKSANNNYFTLQTLTLPGGDTELMKRAFFGVTVTEDATHKFIIAGGHGWLVSEHGLSSRCLALL